MTTNPKLVSCARYLSLVAGAAGLSAACTDLDDELGAEEQSITDGVPDTTHESVGAIRVDNGWDPSTFVCTGTVVGEFTVITAAHCLWNRPADFRFDVGGRTFTPSRIHLHPEGMTPDLNLSVDGRSPILDDGYPDLAVMVFDAPLGVEPSLISTTTVRVGENIALVGFGRTSATNLDSGVRRIAANRIAGLNKYSFRFDGTASRGALGTGNVCFGDSGGPTFAVLDGEEFLVGVHSYGRSPGETFECGYAGYDVRIDPFVDWIRTVAGDDARLVAPPLEARDVTIARRSSTMNGVEYFQIQSDDTWGIGREVYSIAGDGRTTFDYPGRVFDGHLTVAHTAGTDAAAPFTVLMRTVARNGALRTSTAYFPPFSTGVEKMMIHVADDGSTYFADPEGDGYRKYSELLPRREAMTPAHLARSAPRPPSYLSPYADSRRVLRKFGGYGYDAAKYLAVDGAGNVYMTGVIQGPVNLGGGLLLDQNESYAIDRTSVFVASFTRDGVHRWSRRLPDQDVRGLAADAAGNVYVAGASLRTFSSTGQPRWSMPFGADDVAVDGSGNVVAAVTFSANLNIGPRTAVSAGGSDILLVRFSPSGQVIGWTQVGDDQEQSVKAVAVARGGNACLVGNSAMPDGSPASIPLVGNAIDGGFVACFDSIGRSLWTHELDAPAAAPWTFQADLAIDPSGAVYVSGRYEARDTANQRIPGDGFFARLDAATGNPQWFISMPPTRQYFLNARTQEPIFVFADSAERVLVARGNKIASYTHDGVERWQRDHQGGEYDLFFMQHNYYAVSDMTAVTMSAGKVFVAGYFGYGEPISIGDETVTPFREDIFLFTTPDALECGTQSECASWESCGNGYCGACTTSADCGGQQCVAGWCAAP